MTYFWETVDTIAPGLGWRHFGPFHLAVLAVFLLLGAVLCRGLSEGEIAEFLRITDVMLENAKNMNDAREPFPCGRGCDAE